MVRAALRCGTPVVALSFSCTTPARVQNKGRREVQMAAVGEELKVETVTSR